MRPTQHVSLFMEKFPAQSETWNWSVAKGLVERNYDVSVVAGHEGNWEVIGGRSAFDGRALYPERYFSAGTHSKWRYGMDLALEMGKLFAHAPRAAARALRTYPLHRVTGAASIWTHTFVRHALHAPTLAHGLFGLSARRALMLRSAGFLEGPVVATFGGFDINVVGAREGPTYYRELFAKVDRIIAVSEFIKRRLVEHGAPADRIDVVYYGVNLEQFTYRLATPKPTNARFIMVGRLVECKGIEYAIEAFQRLRKTHPNIELVIVGAGELEDALRVLAQRGGDQNIRFTGMIPHDQVQQELHQADILLAPGVVGRDGAEEALGGSVIEAHAVGLPVIASNVGGLTEAMRPHKSGMVVPPRDAPALANAMQTMLERADTWQQMGAAGRRAHRGKLQRRRLPGPLRSRVRPRMGALPTRLTDPAGVGVRGVECFVKVF